MLSLFSGIGAFEKALKNLDIPFELVGYCEIDKYASRSYSAIHDVPETMNLGDITKIDERALPKDIDLITYGFPCQDISLAGKQKGLFNEDGTQTRSGLFFEALRIIEETQPKIAIAENVKNLVGKKFNAQFQVVLASLEAAGYNNYWQVLNAKDYGIPQNRERVFIVSIRKDIYTGSFTFPEAFPLELRLKDMLEDVVDEKYYLDGKFESVTPINENYSMLNGGTMGKMHDISRRAYSENATAPSIHTCAGGNLQPKVIIEDFYKNRDARIYEEAAPTLRGERTGLKVVEPVALDEQNGYIRKDGCVGTLTTDGSSPKHNNRVIEPVTTKSVERTPLKFLGRNQKNVEGDYAFCVDTAQTGGIKENMSDGTLRIRKLTPKECFRLMGFSDEDFAKAEAVNSNTQLYKQAGNSIVVDVIVHIFKRLKPSFKPEYRDGDPDCPICPNCRLPLNEMEDCDCGQKIDWSEE